MADVRVHLNRLNDQATMLRVTAKLMQSAEAGNMFNIGSHGAILLKTFSGMMHSMATSIEDQIKDLDLAISMQGHEKR